MQSGQFLSRSFIVLLQVRQTVVIRLVNTHRTGGCSNVETCDYYLVPKEEFSPLRVSLLTDRQ